MNFFEQLNQLVKNLKKWGDGMRKAANDYKAAADKVLAAQVVQNAKLKEIENEAKKITKTMNEESGCPPGPEVELTPVPEFPADRTLN